MVKRENNCTEDQAVSGGPEDRHRRHAKRGRRKTNQRAPHPSIRRRLLTKELPDPEILHPKVIDIPGVVEPEDPHWGSQHTSWKDGGGKEQVSHPLPPDDLPQFSTLPCQQDRGDEMRRLQDHQRGKECDHV